MNIVLFGDIIRARRELLKISQEDLCAGLLSVSSLSRIENGMQMPSTQTLYAIAERLGIPAERLLLMGSHTDLDTQALCEEIIDWQIQHKAAEVLPLLAQLEQSATAKEKVTQQFILCNKAIALKGQLTPDEFLSQVQQALTLTMPAFNEDTFDQTVLTSQELNCIINIANAHAQKGEQGRAIRLYKKLLGLYERVYRTGEERLKAIPTISYGLSCLFFFESRYCEAIEVCDKAIDLCIKRRRLERLAHLYANKAYALCKLNRMDEGEPLFHRAYDLLIAVQDSWAAEQMVAQVQKDFDVTIPGHGHNGE